MTTVPESKSCTRCRQVKPLGEFPRDKSKRYGVHTACKACRSARNVEYYAENRDYYAAYHAANADKISERKAEYYEAKTHIYWEANYRRRARAKGVAPRVESFTRDQLIERWGDACVHCGGDWSEVDHFPLSIAQGGAHSLDNCRPSCSTCNHRSWRRAEHDALLNDPPIDEADWTSLPVADSPEDVTTRTIPLDGGTAIVEHVEDRVELTIRLGERIVCGIALTALEAAAIGRALHSPAGATTGDLFHVADALGVNAGDILRLRETAHA